jgi:hypothetical protein
MARGRPSGETGHGEVKAAPEEMYRARLSQKAGAEKLEYTIGLHQRTPEAMSGGMVI